MKTNWCNFAWDCDLCGLMLECEKREIYVNFKRLRQKDDENYPYIFFALLVSFPIVNLSGARALWWEVCEDRWLPFSLVGIWEKEEGKVTKISLFHFFMITGFLVSDREINSTGSTSSWFQNFQEKKTFRDDKEKFNRLSTPVVTVLIAKFHVFSESRKRNEIIFRNS